MKERADAGWRTVRPGATVSPGGVFGGCGFAGGVGDAGGGGVEEDEEESSGAGTGVEGVSYPNQQPGVGDDADDCAPWFLSTRTSDSCGNCRNCTRMCGRLNGRDGRVPVWCFLPQRIL